MPLPKLYLTPAQDGYAAQDADDAVLRAKVSAGPSRTRLDMLGAPADVSVTFQMNPNEYQYWRAFFRSTIVEGSLPFLLDLLLDFPELTEHQVKIVPGSARLSGQRGLLYVVSMRLEVKVVEADADLDATVAMLFEQYGDQGDAILISLERLVNFDLAVLS